MFPNARVLTESPGGESAEPHPLDDQLDRDVENCPTRMVRPIFDDSSPLASSRDTNSTVVTTTFLEDVTEETISHGTSPDTRRAHSNREETTRTQDLISEGSRVGSISSRSDQARAMT